MGIDEVKHNDIRRLFWCWTLLWIDLDGVQELILRKIQASTKLKKLDIPIANKYN